MVHVILIAALLLVSCTSVVKTQSFPKLEPGEPSFFATLSAHTDARFVGGNEVRLLLNGDETFPPMLDAIRKAQRSITFEEYFYERGAIADEFAHALAEGCRRGVKVHVLLDSFGANGIRNELIEQMRSSGCAVEWFRRIKLFQFLTPWELLAYNNRNHRRIIVVDGTIGFTGGYGISEAWTGDGRHPDHWRDTNVSIHGPVVQQLQAAFVQDWLETTGTVLGGDEYFPTLTPKGDVTAQIVKSSPAGGASESYMLFLLAISSARQSIFITNPYFVVDEPMRDALVRAAARGVQVNVLVPGKLENEMLRVDQNLVHYAGRSDFGGLLQAGVRLFEYKAALLHAKTMVVDGTWATVGSTNLDRRSFALNKELNLTIFDAGVSRQLERIFWEDLRLSEELTYDEWRSRGFRERILELFAIPAKSQL